MTTTVKHPDRLAEQINNILSNPESWDQETWHSACGTKHCIAGHGQIASGRPMDNVTCRDDAKRWYGLTDGDAEWLFYGDRTLPEMHGFASAALADKPYFNTYGYDRSGCDRYGYDRNGHNRDRNGYNRDGYNRRGYDRNGDSLPLLKIAAGDMQ